MANVEEVNVILMRPNGEWEPVTYTLSSGNIVDVNFIPEESGRYVVKINKNGRPARGSPFTIMVEGGSVSEEDSANIGKSVVGRKCDIDFDIPGVKLPGDLKMMKATLIRPSGNEEPVECKCTIDYAVGINFVPKQVGKHIIKINNKLESVRGSPFIVMVDEDVIQVRGSPLETPSKNESSPVDEEDYADAQPSVGTQCDVDFDLLDVNLPADLKRVRATLINPNGVEESIQCTCTPDNTIGLSFIPLHPGKHMITIKKRRKPVQGSPFIFMVNEDTTKPPPEPTQAMFDSGDITLSTTITLTSNK